MKEPIRIVAACPLARRNPMAALLRGSQYKHQVIKSAKAYSRKGRKMREADHG